jgi:hypothetical protein
MTNETGKAISNAIAFVSKVGEECEALADLIKEEMSNLFCTTPMSGLYKPGEWMHSYETDGHGWVFTHAAWSLPLTLKGRRTVTGYLAFQMSFMCDQPESGCSPEPLLHINFWDDPTDVKGEDYMGFPIRDMAPENISKLINNTARLFRWESDNVAAARWTFSLRLAHINNLVDIRQQICDPVKELLIDIDTGEAALDESAYAVAWSAVPDMPDYYRVDL